MFLGIFFFCSWKKILLVWNFMKLGLKGGISIDVDSVPLGYVLWCCGSRSLDFFTFIQIGSGHTVCFFGYFVNNAINKPRRNEKCSLWIFFQKKYLYIMLSLSPGDKWSYSPTDAVRVMIDKSIKHFYLDRNINFCLFLTQE